MISQDVGSAADAYYDLRYTDGYMDEYWPVEKQGRILEVILSLGLPETGSVLDFGCGNGFFSEIIRKALPGWKVFGSDISTVAVSLARSRYPGCSFISDADSFEYHGKFDLVFTHHVLEHVHDLPASIEAMTRFLKPDGQMLHVLPCGNEGSFEYKLCKLRRDDINTREDRFYFEDEGHVRRLNTTQLTNLLQQYSFVLTKQFYDNHLIGAIKWIACCSPLFIARLFDPRMSGNYMNFIKLSLLLIVFMALSLLLFPVTNISSLIKKRNKSFVQYLVLCLGLFIYLPSLPISLLIDYMHSVEWRERKYDPSGSEMYLCYKRDVVI